MASTPDMVTKPGLLHKVVRHGTEVVTPAEKVYVYEAPVRIWHWVNFLCIAVLAVTGYLIGNPLASVPGEASMNYSFGWVRLIHFGAGMILGVAFLYRLIWAFFGNDHSRQLFLPPVWSSKWWKEVWFEVRWYLFLVREPKKYMGHNPLANLAMFVVFLLPLVNIIVTGFALYAEGAGTGSVWYAAFGWVFTVYGDSFNVHTWHHISMWFILLFSMIHIYLAFREDVMSRQSLISTIVSGWRYFKDDRK